MSAPMVMVTVALAVVAEVIVDLLGHVDTAGEPDGQRQRAGDPADQCNLHSVLPSVGTPAPVAPIYGPAQQRSKRWRLR